MLAVCISISIFGTMVAGERQYGNDAGEGIAEKAGAFIIVEADEDAVGDTSDRSPGTEGGAFRGVEEDSNNVTHGSVHQVILDGQIVPEDHASAIRERQFDTETLVAFIAARRLLVGNRTVPVAEDAVDGFSP